MPYCVEAQNHHKESMIGHKMRDDIHIWQNFEFGLLLHVELRGLESVVVSMFLPTGLSKVKTGIKGGENFGSSCSFLPSTYTWSEQLYPLDQAGNKFIYRTWPRFMQYQVSFTPNSIFLFGSEVNQELFDWKSFRIVSCN